MANVAPCCYPGCRDANGDPELTTDVICMRSRNHYQRVLGWLLEDFALIRDTMPKPVAHAGPKTRAGGSRTYGHPAEWASDKLREIADQLAGWEDALREHLGHDADAVGTNDLNRVNGAYHYLTNWFDQLCTFPAASDAATELDELHRGVRRALGGGPAAQHLPTPCPNCNLLALFRTTIVGIDDVIDCRSCGYKVPLDQYDFYTRLLLTEILAEEKSP